MVKVKVLGVMIMFSCNCFNHPMVKVKDDEESDMLFLHKFQPPYGES